MTNDELKVLEKSMVVKDYPDGYAFKREKQQENAFYLILEGEVEVAHEKGTESGLQHITCMKSGSLLGLHGLIGHFRSIVFCCAKGPVKAAHLPKTAFDLLFQYNTQLPHHFQMIVARQLASDYRNIVKELRQTLINDGQ
jgi:CRP-like cAMP-binding protein